ncbi:MAG: sigma-70 family RNA polymerase sigma factor [Clostridia bacterium]|nr:sigma-70 family RNA polymerase sigma factor [Clostridia bacterium]MBQ3869134.1 sigma-70 family RNA polymerase sigma factor [Clostridia bacterium]
MEKGAENYEKYCNGDNDGLTGLVEEYRGGLILYIYGIVRDMYAAEDLCEDTFYRLITKRPKFDGGKASFRTWLYRMARNIAYDAMRHENTIRFSEIEPEDAAADRTSLEDRYIDGERKRVLLEQIKKLSQNDRELLWLTYFEDMSAPEISKLTGKPVGNVNKALSRARQKLREYLKEEGYGNENE